jgi:hypothetical protein
MYVADIKFTVEWGIYLWSNIKCDNKFN